MKLEGGLGLWTFGRQDDFRSGGWCTQSSVLGR